MIYVIEVSLSYFHAYVVAWRITFTTLHKQNAIS